VTGEGDPAYAALWLAELGAYVPEYKSGRKSEPPRAPAPDDRDRPGQFTSGAAPHPTRAPGRE
jgi:hypothetical protein